jgi:2-polyprenyl-3-methyl-5-hydroxy-6-metoxy-1,4-benzoquinol methylase
MTILESIIEKIEAKNPRHGKKLRTNLTGLEDAFYVEANQFFKKYKAFAKKEGKDIDYGIECYLKVVSDYIYEQIRFMQTGQYSCKSFADAYEKVYNNPEVMEYYMHGLLMTQFLWKHHFDILKFFRKSLNTATKVDKYLEIGGGHGMYLDEATRIFKGKTAFHMVDISKSSLDIAKSFVKSKRVEFNLQDIYLYNVAVKYDFITMGEVLEHVEQPVDLMKQIHRLLTDDGYAYITTPANAPAIDHIYLFEDPESVRKVFDEAGFKVIDEMSIFTEDDAKGKKHNIKVPLMYAALLKKK